MASDPSAACLGPPFISERRSPSDEEPARRLPSPPLPRFVVRPPLRGEMLNPFGRSRQLKEYLFLRSFPKARKTAADIETRALKGLQLQMGGGPRETTGNSASGGPGHSSEGPFESSDAPEGNQQPEDASGRNNGAAACVSPTAPARLIPRKASAAQAEIASAESATAEPAAAAPAGASPVAAAPVEASPSAASLATAAPAAAARRMTLSEAAASVGRQLPLRSSTLQQQHPLGLQSLPTQRVNQLDAVRVNNEIVLLLQDMLLQCTRAAAPWLQQWQQELQLLLHSFLWAVSTARDKPTPGDLLQNVKYYGGEQLHQQQLEQQQQRFQALQQDPTAVPAAVQQQQRVLLHLMLKQQHSLMQRQPLAWKHKLGLLLLHVLLPYFYQLLRQQLHRKRQQQQAAIEQRIRRYNVAQALRRQRMQQQEQQQQQHGEEATEKEQRELCHQLQQRQKQQNLRWPDAAVGNAVTRLTAAERSLEWVYRCFMCIDLLLSLIRFVFFFYFLYRGKHRSVGDWLLGLEMRHIHPSLRRSLSFELLQQQLYWLSVSQVLLLLAPHIDLLLLRRTLRLRLLTPARRAAVASLQQFRLFLRRQRHQQLQQYGTAIEEKGLAAAVAALPFELGQWGLLLLRSTKQQGTKLLQDVGLLPHPLVTKQQQQPGVESGEGRLAVEQSRLKPPTGEKLPESAEEQHSSAAALHIPPSPPPATSETQRKQQKEQNNRKQQQKKRDQELQQQEQQQHQLCVFCSKEPLLPFRSSACPHIFCYWCVASHPEHRPGPWEPLEGDEGEVQLRCPQCAAVVGSLLWGV